MSRRFHFEWRTALLTVVLLPTMISLGFWQLRRADENRQIIQVAEQRRQQLPLALEQLTAKQVAQDIGSGQSARWLLQQISLRGQWLDRSFLLENQTHEGRNGYHVIGVLKLADGGHVLVNRGWIIAPALRSELPAIPAATSGSEERGEIYVTPSVLQEGPVFAESGWPRRIAKLNVPGLAHELGVEVLPAIVRLREGSPSALTAQWPVVNIAPEKNIAYAIQWFAMSAALVLFYLALSFRREVINNTLNEASDG
jgi:surfeit locus 1 family protein